MKKILVSAISVLLLLSTSPLFAQEESLFLEDSLTQDESVIEDVFDEPLFQIEPVQQAEEPVVQPSAKNPANTRVLNELKEQTRTKVASITRNNSRRSTSAQNQIISIEGLKQQYLQQTSGLNDSDDAYVQEMNEKCEAEIQARMLEEQRMAELEADGVTLNSRGQKRLENDIAGIKEKYEKLIEKHKKSSVNAQTQSSLLAQINSGIRSVMSVIVSVVYLFRTFLRCFTVWLSSLSVISSM